MLHSLTHMQGQAIRRIPYRILYVRMHTGCTSFHKYQTNHISELITIIKEEKTLTTSRKELFKSYWREHHLQSAKNRPIASLLKEVDLPSFVRFISKTKLKSSTARGIYRREIMYNNSDVSFANELVNTISGEGITFHTKDDVFRWCFFDSLTTNDILMAADIFLLYYSNNNETIDNELTLKLITALSFQNPPYDKPHLKKFLKLCQLMEKRSSSLTLTRFQLQNLCDKALSLDNTPLLSKLVLTKLMHANFYPSTKTRDSKMMVAYKLIDQDYQMRNVSGVFLTWTTIKNHYTSFDKHDPRILYKVFKIAKQNKAYLGVCRELMEKLTPVYYCNDPLLLPVVINYTTQIGDFDQATQLIKDMKENMNDAAQNRRFYRKRTLNSLLKLHLKFHDFSSVDKILKEIVDLFGKLSSSNYQAIISHLLNTEKVDNLKKALKLLNIIEPSERLSAYATLITKLVEWNLAGKSALSRNHLAVINELLTKADKQDPEHLNSLWNIVASLYIKTLLHCTNKSSGKSSNTKIKSSTKSLDLAKLIFLKSVNVSNTKEVDSNPFSTFDPYNIKLKLSSSNKVVILKNIAMVALKCKRKDIFLWCCSMLYQDGMSSIDLMADWNIILKHQFRKSRYESLDSFLNNSTKEGVKFIKDTLK
ncbi:hypothetical protein KAFR_0G03800 [Kazachstania africana CBS 2517]|uniref:Uncharacterized protein n=1 Tax=Kazachstania africana (strain ATCC 22294 / BCRC 22015 / CBS 2517 / CECT 1963 / NBRC 1671 / NRRL Y-8276) TaxID=1071382 RepID=H2AYG3_KAZAF|nr:hypothetical protein KAFR_0G03800 [Kazachstania africana CBS 2517]CCF59413.1 hypothetical protein KAFR_0G03800 [Kazachstania africana CBS 2517]